MPEMKSHLTRGETWRRGFLVLLFALLFSVAEVVVTAVVLLQFGSHLITGAPIARLLDFTRGLNAYLYQVLQFVTYRADVLPFPLGQWPGAGLEDVAVAEAGAPAASVSHAADEPREY